MGVIDTSPPFVPLDVPGGLVAAADAARRKMLEHGDEPAEFEVRFAPDLVAMIGRDLPRWTHVDRLWGAPVRFMEEPATAGLHVRANGTRDERAQSNCVIGSDEAVTIASLNF